VTDRIELRAMRFAASHGVLPFEAERRQPFEVDVVVELDLAPAGTADDLARTVDFGAVFAAARSVVEGSRVALVETLAERIAAAVLAGSPAATAVTVRVRKPEAPLPGELAWAGVEIRRSR
jgi:7,8-dihydroneopterin aldolase/epimerase/oxygenase